MDSLPDPSVTDRDAPASPLRLPQPYYEDAWSTIYHGDAVDLLPHLSADLVITDPPFGIGDSPLRGNRGITNDYHPVTDWDDSIDPEWCRLSCASAPVVAWFGQWRKRGEVERGMAWPLRCELIWAKDTHVSPPCPAAMRDERIWVFSEAAVKPTRFETTVWDVPIIPTWSHKWHKNEKPLPLMTRLVSWLDGDTVLDPFMGSGTTLRAAKNLGRRAIGVDISEAYCEIAAKRLAQEVLDFGGVA